MKNQTFQVLHSDNLRQQFGDIKAEIVLQKNDFRVCKLIDSSGVTRTFASSTFNREDLPFNCTEADLSIKNGGLIGDELRKAKVNTKKTILNNFLISIPDWLKSFFRDIHTIAFGQFSSISVNIDGNTFVYVYIIEIFSPEVRFEEKIGKPYLEPPKKILDLLKIAKLDGQKLYLKS